MKPLKILLWYMDVCTDQFASTIYSTGIPGSKQKFTTAVSL